MKQGLSAVIFIGNLWQSHQAAIIQTIDLLIDLQLNEKLTLRLIDTIQSVEHITHTFNVGVRFCTQFSQQKITH